MIIPIIGGEPAVVICKPTLVGRRGSPCRVHDGSSETRRQVHRRERLRAALASLVASGAVYR